MADQRHGFVAAPTGGRRCGRRGLHQGWLPIEQGEDALPSGFGGRAEPAEVADALKALGQNVLEEAAKKLGVTENTLKARLWRARHQMAERLGRRLRRFSDDMTGKNGNAGAGMMGEEACGYC